MYSLYKYFCTLSAACLLSCTLLTGCGPAEEKIAEAQNKYTELVDIHNQVAEAHKEISDDSLDSDLMTLYGKLDQVDEFNLNEMKDEEIDTLISSMDTLITSYQDYLASIAQIKANEEASVIVTIPMTLSNDSGLTFHKLMLYEKGDTSSLQNILDEDAPFVTGAHMTGLYIYRDVSNTPWILEAEDSEGNNYEFELSVETYTEEGFALTFTYDSENQELKCT